MIEAYAFSREMECFKSSNNGDVVLSNNVQPQPLNRFNILVNNAYEKVSSRFWYRLFQTANCSISRISYSKMARTWLERVIVRIETARGHVLVSPTRLYTPRPYSLTHCAVARLGCASCYQKDWILIASHRLHFSSRCNPIHTHLFSTLTILCVSFTTNLRYSTFLYRFQITHDSVFNRSSYNEVNLN